MKHSTTKPTKEEAERIERMLALGCLLCGVTTKAEVHHIVEGNKRLGHLFTIPLCAGHHRGVWTARQKSKFAVLRMEAPPSIASGSKLFTARYGSQKELYLLVQTALGLPYDWPESKVFPRRIA